MTLPQSKTAAEALSAVRSGQSVLVGSGAAQPRDLVEALAARGPELYGVEVLHLLTLGEAPYAEARFAGHLRHNALFIGGNVRSAVREGLADYTPCYLSELPRLIREGRIPVDVALIQVTPPRRGQCSLGVSVDILKAAVQSARVVIAQVNSRMPETRGDTRVAVDDIDAFVQGDRALPELAAAAPTSEAEAIGKYAARLVEDGATIQAGIGTIPNAVMAALAGKKDLGVHSEMISDGVLDLVRAGAVTGRRKTLHRGKVVTGFCLGTKRLYEAVGADPRFELYPIDHINDPRVIAQNDRMVSVNSALQVDLTGQVAADSVDGRFYSGVGGQVDFIRGASMSRGGRSIIAMPSTAKRRTVSRIVVCLPEGTGVVTTRADVDFVVTEYGIASLKGKTIRERTVALIGIAHPAFRSALAVEARKRGYLDAGFPILPQALPYEAELERCERFGTAEVRFRPMKPSDERRLKELFYSQSQETTLMRFGIPLKTLTEKQFHDLVCVDFRGSMAIAGFVREKGRERMICVGRYCGSPGSKTADAAFTVHDDYQDRGIGKFLIRYLGELARARGLRTLTAEISASNVRMQRAFYSCFSGIKQTELGPDGITLAIPL